eukprot:gene27516-33235_t
MEDLNLSNYVSAKIRLDDLLNQFLRAEGNNLVALLKGSLSSSMWISPSDVLTESRELPLGSSSSEWTTASPTSSPNVPRSNLGKKSPKKRPQSEITPSPTARSTPLSETTNELAQLNISTDIAAPASVSPVKDTTEHINHRRRANFDTIPQFYVPNRRNSYKYHLIEDDKLVKRLPEIEAFFKPFPGGIPVEKFVHVTKRLCGIPSFFNLPLCKRINELYGDPDCGIPAPRIIGKANRQPSGVRIKLKTFLKFWSAEIEPYDRTERFFNIIKQPNHEYIYNNDFIPFLQELLHFHPGLDFLEQHEEFQHKYALTVITRIFYKVNTSFSGKLSLAEVRRSNLFTACMHVDEETDINKVLDYFSYEHFYVLYCKFFELDSDKDSKIMKADLLKYGEHALSECIVDRIYQVGYRVFSDAQWSGFPDGMAYQDFIYFMLSEEDKTSPCALRYWFMCCDLDGDKKLSPEEMRYFYRNQIHRITSLGQESINFEDVLCQMMDMVHPEDTHAINLHDLVRPDKRMISGVLFDVLFNLHKFLRFEARDPFQEKLRREDVFHTDWDRFAHMEYTRLAQEEEDAAGYDNSMDIDSMLQTSDPPGNNVGGNALGNAWSLNDEESEDEDNEDESPLIGNRLISHQGGGKR